MRPFPFISIVLTSLLVLGCSRPPAPASKTVEKLICTSFYPMYVATINITRDVAGVKVVNMTQPFTGCLHDYQLTPENLKLLSTADFFIVNGLGMEQFMEKVISQLPKLKIIEASKDISTFKDEDGEINPHVWVSISGAIEQVRNISSELSTLDPTHAEQYRRNAADYVARLEKLKTQMHEAIKACKKRDIIVFHEAFPYFAKEFNLHIVGVIEREPGSEPSAKEIAGTIGLIKKVGVKAIFVEPQYPTNSADAIKNETGVKVLTLDPCVTGSLDLPEVYNSYTKAMEQNLAALVEALH